MGRTVNYTVKTPDPVNTVFFTCCRRINFDNIAMMQGNAYNNLLCQYEFLRARLYIRDHYLKTIVEEIYEHIGQELSLARVYLSLFKTSRDLNNTEKLDMSGEIIGKSIHDLRKLGRMFRPENDIINSAGFSQAVENEIKKKFPDAKCNIADESMTLVVQEKRCFVFGILLELITLIGMQEGGELGLVSIQKMNSNIDITMNYSGEKLKKQKKGNAGEFPELTIFRKAELIGGCLKINPPKNGWIQIRLKIPMN